MNELFDKQVNAQKQKNFRGSCKLLQAHKKVCDEMKQRNKQENSNMRIKMLLKEGRPRVEKQYD